MGEGAGHQRIEFPVHEVPWSEIKSRFGAAQRAERLPTKEVKSARWFASEAACAALVPAGGKRGRIKGTLTLPEWRGFGYGLDVMWRVFDEAHKEGYEEMEVFTRHPGWFERHGWWTVREASWGTPVMRANLNDLILLKPQ